MDTPAELKYTSDHEWVRIDGDVATVGITDYAQDALGDVVFVQLPQVGLTAAQSDSVSEVESTKSVSDIYTPLDGEIIEVNSDLESDPAALNSDPYGRGWIFKIKLAVTAAPEGLLDADAYRALVEG